MSANLAKMKKGDVAWVSAFTVGRNGCVTLDIPVVRIECIVDVPAHFSFYSLQSHKYLDHYFKRAKKYPTKLLETSHHHSTEEEAVKYYEERITCAVKEVEREAERLTNRAKELAMHTLVKKNSKTKLNLTI